MRKVAILALTGATVLGPAAAAQAAGVAPEERSITGTVSPNQAGRAVRLSFNLGTTRPDGRLPNIALRDRITLPSGFRYNGGLRRNPTGSATAFSVCTGPDNNRNGIPDRVEAQGGPQCPTASQVGFGSATAFVHQCGDAATPASAEAAGRRETLTIRIFNGGGRLAGNGGTLYAFLTGTPVAINAVLKVSFSGNRISFEVPDNLVSPVPGICSPLVSTLLNLARRTATSSPSVLTANTTVRRRVRGRLRTFTVRRGLVEAGPCPSNRRWSFVDTVEFGTGARDANGNVIRASSAPEVTSETGDGLVTCRR